MPLNNFRNNKKKALLHKKEMILKELGFYDQRIKEVRCELSKPHSFDDYASSDSDNEFPVLRPTGPSAAQLTQKLKMMKTSLQATEELTGVEVLQSEVNIMVNEPELDSHSRINELGIWREVAAECQMDQINFSIEFYAFRKDEKFAPTLYRCLRVTPAKPAQEKELSTSVLPATKNPSDALEVLRNYSAAYRSRRFTLARLMDKFGPALYMEPLAEGGYQLKCANVLEVSWMLQNKWSPIAPFQHKMKFDLENLEESYIKRIAQLYRQVSDPMVETEERTLLLASIISTCLEANPPQLESSVEEPSDVEMARKDSEVMAPPKSAPKKTKPKTKENAKEITSGDQEAVKRSINEIDTIKAAKKLKTSEGVLESGSKTTQKQINLNENEGTVEPTEKRAVKRTTNEDNTKDNAKKSKISENITTQKQTNTIESENVTRPSEEPIKSVRKSVNEENTVRKTKKSKSSEASLENVNKATQKQKSPTEKNNVKETTEKPTKNVPNPNEKDNKNAASANSKTGKVTKINVASKISENSVKTNEKSGKAKVNKTGKENKANEKGESKENASGKPTDSKKPKTSITAKTNEQKNTNNAKKKSPSAITAKTQSTTKNIADKAKETRNTKVATTKIATRRSLSNLNTVNAPIKTITARNSEPKIAATTSKESLKGLKEVNVAKKPKDNENKIITTNSGKKVIRTVKTITNDKGEVIKKVVKKLVNPSEGNRVKSAQKPAVINKNNINQPKFGVTNNNVPTSDKLVKKNVNAIAKPLKENAVNDAKTTTAKSTAFLKPTTSTTSTISQKTGNKVIQNSNTEKENSAKRVSSKIPQIKTSTPKKFLKKAPLRVSPRKPIPKPKSPLNRGKKVILKPVTNIPRLLNKPKPKVN